MTPTLGKKYRDTVTGYQGTAIALTKWLHGCDRLTLQGPIGTDGKIPDSVTFDVLQLVDVEEAESELLALIRKDTEQRERRETGGPRSEPSRGR